MNGEVDARNLLEDASRLPGEGALAPEAHWTTGRRRRARKRVGGALASGVATVVAVGLVWQTGFFGGQGAGQDVAAEFPEGGTTFVFAAEGVAAADPAPDPATISAVAPVAADDLAGTSWSLRDELWRGGTAAGVVGAAADTRLAFPADGGGWGVSIDGCGDASAQGDLRLDEDGSFGPQRVGTNDIGCADAVQAAEDFWLEALGGGGSIVRLGGEESGLLLLTVVAPVTDEPVAATDDAPSRTTVVADEPSDGPREEDEEPSSPVEPTTAPSAEPTVESEPSTPVIATPDPGSAAPEPTGGEPVEPAAPVVDPGTGVDPGAGEGPDLPWTAPEQASDGGGGLLGGGTGIFAPTLRAGAHDGFDRVVVDLTGPEGAAPGWVASYEADPTRDGSGAPAGVAGDSVLQLVLAGMAYPEPGDPVYDGGDAGLDTHTLGAVVEVIRTTPFEGQLQVFIGMSGEPRPYRVFTLTDPLRLVVDVQTP